MQDDCCTIKINGRPAPAQRVRAINPTAFELCYLCGELLDAEKTRDHIPPKQFFPKVFRHANTTDQLEWLPTHRDCNRSYQRDEEYFVHTFGLPAAAVTPSGHALGHDIRDRFRKGEQRPLVTIVMNEFEQRSNMKSFQSGRINRVAWKVVRGLHCLRTGELLPERPRIQGGFTCDKTPLVSRDLAVRLHAAGFHDQWEGTLPTIFKSMTLVDEALDRTTYTYFLVCWEYVTYFLIFHMNDGQFIQPQPSVTFSLLDTRS